MERTSSDIPNGMRSISIFFPMCFYTRECEIHQSRRGVSNTTPIEGVAWWGPAITIYLFLLSLQNFSTKIKYRDVIFPCIKGGIDFIKGEFLIKCGKLLNATLPFFYSKDQENLWWTRAYIEGAKCLFQFDCKRKMCD